MLGQLVAAQFSLEAVIAELASGGASAALADSQAQLMALSALQRQVGTAQPMALAALWAEVSAVVAQTNAIAQEGRLAAARAETERAEGASLTTLAAAARTQVAATMQGMADFDGELEFSSPDDEEAYRKREAERRAYIEAELAKGTPQGDLNASAGALGQMADAKAHGAGDSPEFRQRWNELVTTTERLRAEVVRNGGSTTEFDDRLRADLRRILKAKGLTDAQIDAQFAAHPDPLEAAKAFVAGDDVSTLGRAVEGTAKRLVTHSPEIVADSGASPAISEEDALAEFRAAGITTAEQTPDAEFAHGIAEAHAKPASRSVSV
ncbi:hypothetical protein P1X14_12385 [Sphingomonas sp. AOB5]|uniref:hypothetical protein n=1 Tax=Sphingomonas sp. AOB5 TaxID=3034017 RepID=UPI0023F976AB|nr:hypothetical protein [Sphingomonas sp. AOB5]MDF7776048.1 hypothetical protein [Sphingomonas sp. AOB5]